MSSDKTPNWVLPLVIGLLLMGGLGCGAVVVVFVAGGAAAFLMASAPMPPQPVGGPIAIRQAATPTPASASPRKTDGLFVVSTVTGTIDGLPTRFNGPLPIDPDEFDEMQEGGKEYPPYSYVAGRACAGDAAMNAKILSAVKAMEVTGFGDLLPETYGAIYESCEDDRPCTFLASVVTGRENDAVKAPFWLGLAECEDPSAVKAFERPDSDANAYLAWVMNRERGTPAIPWTKRFEEATAKVIAEGDEYDAHDAAFSLGSTDDPRVAKALVAIFTAERTPEKKKTIAFAMFKQSDAAAKAIFRRMCNDSVDPDPVCDGEGFALPTPDLAKDELSDLVEDYEVDLHALIKARGTTQRAPLVAKLITCAEDEDWRGNECLAALAAMDWTRAAELAATLEAEDPGSSELVHVLGKFPNRAAWIARMKKEGLLHTTDPVDADAIDPRTLLEEAERATMFDVETGMFPNEHDRLLQKLARLARPELDGILFLETPPKEESGEAYRLEAWLGGKHWEVSAEDLGDWYDLETCLALLNRILEERASATRFVALETGDQTTVVVAGPREGIVRLASEKLLSAGGASESATQGKEFEDKVLEDLR